jgi:glycosyltransferase involved in cell wall biosynthesis
MTRRVLVLSEYPIDHNLAGNGIRAVELARVLAAQAEVVLASPGAADSYEGIPHVHLSPARPQALAPLLAGIDVVVAQPQGPEIRAMLCRCGARVVYDVYDPKPLEVFETFLSASRLRQRYWRTLSLDHYCAALTEADFLICASERQRDLWIGTLLGLRALTPAAYSEDPSLRNLIAVVPLGVPAEPPAPRGDGPRSRFPKLDRDAEIVLWNGGIWNWLDATAAVESIARVVENRPRARLVFMVRGPGNETEARQATAARRRAADLDLLDEIVFFNDEIVGYENRADWLLASGCALTLHGDHIEARYAVRTRLLDCFWAGLPVVCSGGDELAERIASDGLGEVVAPGDVGATATAIERVLSRGRAAYREELASAAAALSWPTVTAPLVRYVEELPAARPRSRQAAGLRLRSVAARVVRRAAALTSSRDRSR